MVVASAFVDNRSCDALERVVFTGKIQCIAALCLCLFVFVFFFFYDNNNFLGYGKLEIQST